MVPDARLPRVLCTPPPHRCPQALTYTVVNSQNKKEHISLLKGVNVQRQRVKPSPGK